MELGRVLDENVFLEKYCSRKILNIFKHIGPVTLQQIVIDIWHVRLCDNNVFLDISTLIKLGNIGKIFGEEICIYAPIW